jgi:hypothetical protein
MVHPTLAKEGVAVADRSGRLGGWLEALDRGPRPEDFKHLQSLIGLAWVREALERSGTETLRRRKLPNEVVVWLVIGLAMFRSWSIEYTVKHLGLGSQAGKGPVGKFVSSAAIVKARVRVGVSALLELFEITALSWIREFEDFNRWRDLGLFALDGSTLRVADTAGNEEVYGRPGSSRSPAAYPQARLVAIVGVGCRMVLDFVVGTLAQSEQVLAQMLLGNLPDRSLLILDRGFVNYAIFARIIQTGAEHYFLCRAKKGLKAKIVRELGPGDVLVELTVSARHRREDPTLPKTIVVRRLDYQIAGFQPQQLFTSLLEPRAYPAREVIALYHKRWEIEIAYDEIKTHTLEREETLRSRNPELVLQEIYGLLLAYNLVRVLMARAARQAGVEPYRMSYRNSLLEARVFLMGAWAVAPGALPRHYKRLCAELAHLVLPERRSRRYPRAVKIKMSSYPRKKPN